MVQAVLNLNCSVMDGSRKNNGYPVSARDLPEYADHGRGALATWGESPLRPRSDRGLRCSEHQPLACSPWLPLLRLPTATLTSRLSF